MRHLALALTLALAACASNTPQETVKRIQDVAQQVDPIAKNAELQLDTVSTIFDQAQASARGLCSLAPETCPQLATAELQVKQALDVATLALADYRAGRAALDQLAEAVNLAAGALADFAALVR